VDHKHLSDQVSDFFIHIIVFNTPLQKTNI
jgi:hypothetical protein